jgi:hypothetical protein
MIAVLGPLVALSLVIPVAVDRVVPEPTAIDPRSMTKQEQRAAMMPLIRTANECIARSVSADPRFAAQSTRGDVNELIVDSIPVCLDAVHALIDQHDRIFGAGTGEGFFMGQFLDALPLVVHGLLKNGAR